MTKNQHDTIRSHPAYSLHPKFFGCAVASLTLVVGLSAAGPVAAQTVAGGAYQQQYEWTQPTAEEVHLRLIAWMQDQDVDVDVEAAVNDLWPEDLASMPGDALLDRLAQSIAVVDERAAALAEVCLAPRQGLALPEVAWLAGDDVSSFVRNHLRLLAGRWLMHEQLYDEAYEQLHGLEPDDVIDPAMLLFCQSVVYHRLLYKDEALAALELLTTGVRDVPRRYEAVATLMREDLRDLKDESLDHIARRMEDIRRRLDLGHAGPKVRSVEDGVIASLDKLIEQIEQQQQQQSSAGAATPTGQPAEDSRILGGSGPGDVADKRLGAPGGWGDLPPKQREETLQSIGRQFPAHYRDVIEQYFRKLADQGTDPADRATSSGENLP